MLERNFQSKLIQELYSLYPGALILKNDENYIQGIPDLLILYENKWAMLECKKQTSAKFQPNQEYYVDMLDKMSFAAFIRPDNKEEILNELQQTLRPRRAARLSRSK